MSDDTTGLEWRKSFRGDGFVIFEEQDGRVEV